MSVRTTIRVPDDLIKLARRRAAAEGRTLTSLIEEGLRLVLAEPSKKKRCLPPVSKAGGGLVPNVDLTDMSALIDQEDMDYIERMKRFE